MPYFISSLLNCLVLNVLYVGSLYIWRDKNPRNHPRQMLQRFVSVGIVNLLSPLYVHLTLDLSTFPDQNLWHVLGFRQDGFLQAVCIPTLLTALLFLGPLVMIALEGAFLLGDHSWNNAVENLKWVRNVVVAPLSEELVFRACMLPYIVPAYGNAYAIVICPLFFGLAHFHHLLERITSRHDFTRAICESAFQVFYTTVFGMYSSYLFLRTGHVVAPILVHAFCNYIGFPEVSRIDEFPPWQRMLIKIAFCLGLVSWIVLLVPLTSPSIYMNTIWA